MIVEYGLGLDNANSYVDVDYADNYFSVRGAKSWEDLDTETKQVCLVKATDYIDNVFDWNGTKSTKEQALKFPRKNLIDSDGFEVLGIPLCLKDAVCECAVKVSENAELYQTAETNGAVISEKIGELAFTYDVSQKAKDKTLYDVINLKLRGLYKDKNSSRIVMGVYSK